MQHDACRSLVVVLIAGLYDAETFERLRLPDGNDAWLLQLVKVVRPATPPALDRLDMSLRLAADIGNVRLLGGRLNKLGADHAPHTPLLPGEPLSVVLFWQALVEAPTFPQLSLQLRDATGTSRATWDWTPVKGRYDPVGWRAGEIVRDPQTYSLPGDLPAGTYQLVLAEASQLVQLDTLTVEAAANTQGISTTLPIANLR